MLGEVKRKQTDATRAVELLRALRKLRGTRKLEAEVKGKFPVVVFGECNLFKCVLVFFLFEIVFRVKEI